MLKHLTATVVALALLAFNGLLQASDGGKGPGSNSGPGKAGDAAKVKFEGMVTAIAPAANGVTLTVATGPTTATTVLVTAATKIEIDEKAAAVTDIVIGDVVEVEATALGIATKVEVEDDDDDMP